MTPSPLQSIETRASWVTASVALWLMTMAFGANWITSVALTTIAAEVNGARSVPALAMSLTWLGAAVGGILMGRIANRIGIRWTVIGGSLMIAIGLTISTIGPPWPLWIGHGLFMGLIGLSGINAPMYIYTSQWFDRRRGSALALISSGSYFAGALWPPIFERAVAYIGWRHTMLTYAVLEMAVIIPLALIFLKPPPEITLAAAGHPAATRVAPARPLGLPRNVFFVLLCLAGILCCIPMAMPQQHLVAFCSDVGFSLATGAAMLSVLLGTAFLSRQIWGVISDRIGGLMTLLIGSGAQAIALSGFLVTQDEFGLFAVAFAFGLGFSAIIPAYALAVRELFPAPEAFWRIPTVLMCTGIGMASGGWLAGFLYDRFGYYLPAFGFGVFSNVLNFMILGFLLWCLSRAQTPTAATGTPANATA
ncbi:MAG: MFS transporter [Pseudolabrys sp.]|nr:MFS transporter [Pseudolabrys sp.]MCW5686861.1 MFS transporter [Pseudolabrys sp.]